MPAVCPICGPIPGFDPMAPGAMERHVESEEHQRQAELTASIMEKAEDAAQGDRLADHRDHD